MDTIKILLRMFVNNVFHHAPHVLHKTLVKPVLKDYSYINHNVYNLVLMVPMLMTMLVQLVLQDVLLVTMPLNVLHALMVHSYLKLNVLKHVLLDNMLILILTLVKDVIVLVLHVMDHLSKNVLDVKKDSY